MSDFLLLTVAVALALAAFGVYMWVGAVAIGCAWPYDNFAYPFWGSGRWKFAAGFFAVTVLGISIFIYALSTDAPKHGSCKHDHWGGKSYVCDEYYPLPVHE